MRIQKLTSSFVFLLLATAAAHAQYTRGYAYVAPGGITQGGATGASYELGGGVERLLERGVGVGVELEGDVPSTGLARNSVGIFSVNPYYHFLRERRLDPYATAGYSLVFRDFARNAFNWGGGVNYWFQDNLGVLLEFRDHIWTPAGAPKSAHYWGLRIGLTFR